MTETEIEKVETKPLAISEAEPSIERIVLAAIEAGRTAGEMQGFLDLHERMQAAKNLQAFNAALVAFQADCPPIPRKAKADFATKSGRMAYDYADLDTILAVIQPVLTKHGLGCRWPKSLVTKDGEGTIHVVCRISHVDGHSDDTESAEFPLATNAQMSPQQKTSSAETTAKRRSLVSALGLSTVQDLDGNEPDGPAETITDDQARQIEDKLNQLGVESEIKRAREEVLKYIEREKLSDCPAVMYGRVLNKLQATLDAQGGT